jgi:putative sterol carrier protein
MVNNKNMTAIEWLKKKCEDSLNKEPDNPSEREIGYSIALKHFITLIENKAKQMEKEQIKDAYVGNNDDEFGLLIKIKDMAEQYYNETYGK